MDKNAILSLRQQHQSILKPNFKSAKEMLQHFGAIQGQDDAGSRWSMGLRLFNGTEKMVEEAIVEGSILRTWMMRGTLAYIAAEDVGWMLKLLAPRLLAGRHLRRKSLNLDEGKLLKCKEAFEAALKGRKILTREEMYQVIGTTGLSAESAMGYHVLSHFALEGLICFGPKKDKQDTFVLLQEWVPHQKNLDEDAALTELAKRYFSSRGPTTLQDFMWWSGLKAADAKKGLAGATNALNQGEIGGKPCWWSASVGGFDLESQESGTVCLLPGFDEYVLGYKDRSLFLESQHAEKICPGNNGMFLPTVVSNGCVVGTWKRAYQKSKVVLTITPFEPLSNQELTDVESSAKKYGHFSGCPAEVRFL